MKKLNAHFQSPSKKKLIRMSLNQQLAEIVPNGPLHGITVIEIGQHVSGPMVGERLARKGALVIKIEPLTGDPARSYLSKEIFTSLNAAKLSIALSKEDTELYNNIFQLADVIIDNRTPESKDNDVVLRHFLQSDNKCKPVIFCSIIGYEGEDNKHLLALDVSVQAFSGLAAVNGVTANAPLKVGFVVLDETTAIEASDQITTYLFALARGQKIPEQDKQVITITVSMIRIAAYLLTGQYLNCLTQNKEPTREGNRDNWLVPFSLYPTKNGMICLAIVNEEQFKRLCLNVLECNEMLMYYPSNKVRLDNVAAFEQALIKILRTQDNNYWLTKCAQYKVPASQVNTVTEALQQPFAQYVITRTTDGTRILADSATSTLYPEKPLYRAPEHNEHRTIVQALIETNNEKVYPNTSEQDDVDTNLAVNSTSSSIFRQAEL